MDPNLCFLRYGLKKFGNTQGKPDALRFHKRLYSSLEQYLQEEHR